MKTIAYLVALLAPSLSFANGIPFPGGVADAQADRAFVASAGGIEAIALSSGATVWHLAAASHPVAIVGRRLLVVAAPRRRNELRFAVVDAHRGTVTSTTSAAALPSWVSIAPAWAHTFDCRATVVGARVLVSWHATASWSQGMHPQEGQEAAARHDQTGAIEVDLDDGSVRVPATTAPSADAASAPGTTLDGHHLLEPDGATWKLLDAKARTLVATVTLPARFSEPAVIGKRLYGIDDSADIVAIDLAANRVRWRHRLPHAAAIAAPQ